MKFEEGCQRTRALASIAGKKSRSYKLTSGEVEEARRLRNEGWTYAALAKRFGVSRRGIREAISMVERQYPAMINTRLAARQDDRL